MLGAYLTVVASDEASGQVMRQLTTKYGKQSTTGNVTECVNEFTGEATSLKRIFWNFPGLNVAYEPTNCEGKGGLWFELPELTEILERDKAIREATEPRI